jgi:hypothetical protein
VSSRPRRADRTVEDLSRDAIEEIRAALVPKRGRFSIVLTWSDWGFFARGAWPRERMAIFRWVVRIGPVEVRRWAS